MKFILNKKDTPQDIRNEISKIVPGIALVGNYAIASTDYTLSDTSSFSSGVTGEDYLQIINYGFLDNDNEFLGVDYVDQVKRVEIDNEVYYVHKHAFSVIRSFLHDASFYKVFMNEEKRVVYCEYGPHIYTNIIACSNVPTNLESVTKKIVIAPDLSLVQEMRDQMNILYKRIVKYMESIRDASNEKVIASHHPVPLRYSNNSIVFVVPERTITKGLVEFFLPEIEATINISQKTIRYVCKKEHPFLLKIKEKTSYGWRGFPHLLNDGIACFGNWSTYIVPAWAAGDIDTIITIATEFLFQVNIEDVAGMTLLYYPSRVVGETKPFDLGLVPIFDKKGISSCAREIIANRYESTEELIDILKELP